VGKERLRSAGAESSWEVAEVRRLGHDEGKLREFWDNRFRALYGELLDDISESGRHGVIAEYIHRLVKSGGIVDVGCGTAVLADSLKLDAIRYTGIDLCDEALAIARRKRGSLDLVHDSIEGFQPKDRFDAVVLNEVIYYLDVPGVFRRVCEWLRGPRVVIVSVFSFPEGIAALEIARDALTVMDEVIVAKPARKLEWNILVGWAP